MRYFAIFLLLLAGCKCEPSAAIKARAAELSSGYTRHTAAIDSLAAQNAIYSESIIAKQDESLTALAAIKSQVESLEASLVRSNPQGKESDPASDTSPDNNANDSHTATQIVAESGDVPLIVSEADFPCPPCDRLKAAIERGDFAGFEVSYSADWKPRRYPAIRYPSASSATGWAVLYGYDSNTVSTLRALTKEVTTSQPVGSFPAYPKASAIASERIVLRSDNRAGRRSGRAGSQTFSWFYSAAYSGR
jgi:hypothetical protein